MPSHRFHTKEIAQVEIYGRMCDLRAKLKNLSVTGAFLEIDKGDFIPQPGDLLKVTVMLNSLNRRRAFDAEVIWSKGLGLGVRFIDRSEVFEKLSFRF